MKEKIIEAYPLSWPEYRPRNKKRENARFNTSFRKARDEIIKEIRLLGGSDMIFSSNIPLRNDGLPYASQSHSGLNDPAVALYFTYKKQSMCFACDRWSKVEDNAKAVAATIAALRGIARWGTGDMLKAAFTGFQALPNPDNQTPWFTDLGLSEEESLDSGLVEKAYKSLRSFHHPDKGGNPEQFKKIQKAYETFKQPKE